MVRFQIQEISESALQRKTNSSQKLADNKFTSEATSPKTLCQCS
jgi:hypothetical protein